MADLSNQSPSFSSATSQTHSHNSATQSNSTVHSSPEVPVVITKAEGDTSTSSTSASAPVSVSNRLTPLNLTAATAISASAPPSIQSSPTPMASASSNSSASISDSLSPAPAAFQSPATSVPDEFDGRLLIDNQSVGVIIGKQGANIARIRQASACSVSILKSENEQNVLERIVVIKGSVPGVAMAIKLMAQFILSTHPKPCKEVLAYISNLQAQRATTSTAPPTEVPRQEPSNDSDTPASTSSTSVPSSSSSSATSNTPSSPASPVEQEYVCMKLLVHKWAVGAIIGKGGIFIKDVQQLTNTKVQISNDVLPHSTEKSVSVVGRPECIEAAFVRILRQLNVYPIQFKPGQRVTPYSPQTTTNLNASIQFSATSHLPQVNPYSKTHPQQQQHHHPQHQQHNQQPSVSSSSAAVDILRIFPHPPSSSSSSSSSNSITERVAIPTISAGAILGKGGSIIRELRVCSGATVSIANPAPETPHERVVTLTGPEYAVQHAAFLIQQLVLQGTREHHQQTQAHRR